MIRGWWNWKLRENESGVPGRRRAPAVAYPLQPRSVRRAATRRTRRLRELATSRRCRTLQSGPCPFNDPLGLKAAGGGKMSPRAQSPNLRSSCAEIKPAKRRSLNPSHPMGQPPGEARGIWRSGPDINIRWSVVEELRSPRSRIRGRRPGSNCSRSPSDQNSSQGENIGGAVSREGLSGWTGTAHCDAGGRGVAVRHGSSSIPLPAYSG